MSYVFTSWCTCVISEDFINYNEVWSYGYCVACGTGVLIHFILHEQGTLNEVVRNLTII